jgi:hypothetical protein
MVKKMCLDQHFDWDLANEYGLMWMEWWYYCPHATSRYDKYLHVLHLFVWGVFEGKCPIITNIPSYTICG